MLVLKAAYSWRRMISIKPSVRRPFIQYPDGGPVADWRLRQDLVLLHTGSANAVLAVWTRADIRRFAHYITSVFVQDE